MSEPWMITLEEHVGSADYFAADLGSATFSDEQGARLEQRLSDVATYRLPEMDELGIATQVLSLTTPAVQGEPSAEQAVLKAQRSNDHLAAIMREFPGRFAGFAAVPCQDPGAAVRELRRCIEELGFCGADDQRPYQWPLSRPRVMRPDLGRARKAQRPPLSPPAHGAHADGGD